MARTKGAKNKPKVTQTTPPTIVEIEIDIPEEKSIWQLLKEAGFPQGGSGNWLKDPKTDEKYYIPHPSELYQLYIGDPTDWEKMSMAMAKVWLQNKR